MDGLVSVIDNYINTLPDCTQKPAYGFMCYFVKGRVFGLYDGEALVLKFDKPAGDQILLQRMGTRFKHAMNASHRSWIRVNPEKVVTDEVLETLIKQSYDYVLNSEPAA